nr:hypothetical protein [Tanacetum cinerariifolium]
ALRHSADDPDRPDLPGVRRQVRADRGHPRPDLRVTGPGPEHRGRPGRSARPGLRGVLRHRRIRSGAGLSVFGAGLLVGIAAGGHCGGVRRLHPRLPGPAHARRLSGHRDPGFR